MIRPRRTTDVGRYLENPVTCQVTPPNIPGYVPYCPSRSPPMWSGRGPGRTRRSRERSSGAQERAGHTWWWRRQRVSRLLGSRWRRRSTTWATKRSSRIRCELGCECLGPRPDAARCRCLVHHMGCHLRIRRGVLRTSARLSCRRRERRLSYNLSNFCDPEVDQRVKRALDLQETDRYRAAQLSRLWTAVSVDMAPLIPYATGRFVAFA